MKVPERLVRAAAFLATPLLWVAIVVPLLLWTEGHREEKAANEVRHSEALERIAAALEKGQP